MKTWYDDALKALTTVREQAPRITFLTTSAQETLLAPCARALGINPFFCQGMGELEDMVRRSGCLVIDMAALERFGQRGLLIAAGVAKRRRVPWFLVASDVQHLKSRSIAARLLQIQRPSLIIGRGEEISSLDRLAGAGWRFLLHRFLGVSAAAPLAIFELDGVVVRQQRKSMEVRAQGPVGVSERAILGPMEFALVAAAVQSTDPLSRKAAIDGAILYHAAVRCAESMTRGPASLLPIFMDALYHLRSEHMMKYVALSEEDVWD